MGVPPSATARRHARAPTRTSLPRGSAAGAGLGRHLARFACSGGSATAAAFVGVRTHTHFLATGRSARAISTGGFHAVSSHSQITVRVLSRRFPKQLGHGGVQRFWRLGATNTNRGRCFVSAALGSRRRRSSPSTEKMRKDGRLENSDTAAPERASALIPLACWGGFQMSANRNPVRRSARRASISDEFRSSAIVPS
jgi:hypothetical protein